MFGHLSKTVIAQSKKFGLRQSLGIEEIALRAILNHKVRRQEINLLKNFFKMILKKNEKIPVGILGATGMVGQKFVELLSHHPWFEVVALAASERSEGKKYGEAMQWMMASPLPSRLANLIVQPCISNLPCQIVFSGLDSKVAGEIEEQFAQKGYIVISNSRNHRMAPDVPLLIPEINPEHLELTQLQRFSQGMIVTNPNCSVIGLTIALKPLIDKWGIEKVHVVTLQAISGAGYPGVPSFDILDNVIPFISGEEEKLETEPLKILGSLENARIQPYQMQISAQCNRVAVMDGHMACVSVKLKHPAKAQELISAWQTFASEPQALDLPTAPKNPVIYLTDDKHPQPKLHRHLDKGMAVAIGRLRKCSLFDWKFAILSHNTIRGAAGCAILNAELMLKKGYITYTFS
jgi:aspartate-semialdehyde dehydrogenase